MKKQTLQELDKKIDEAIQESSSFTTWELHKHYGLYFRCWFRTFFFCSVCHQVYTKSQIRLNKKIMKESELIKS